MSYTELMAENTLQKIHQIATQEFLEKGFRGASLREIVKKAGVTTGAFYGYYKSKEELFSALVKEPADYVSNLFKGLVDQFMQLPKEEWAKNMATYSRDGFVGIFEYAWNHKDAFRLIFFSPSEQTAEILKKLRPSFPGGVPVKMGAQARIQVKIRTMDDFHYGSLPIKLS